MSDEDLPHQRARSDRTISLSLLLLALACGVVAPSADTAEKRRSIPILENVNYPLPGFKRMSLPPLKDQPNLSARKHRHVIRGSQKALTITNSKYLKVRYNHFKTLGRCVSAKWQTGL